MELIEHIPIELPETEEEKKQGTATALERYNGRPLRYTSAIMLRNRIKDYFQKCTEIEEVPTILGLALWLDVTAETLKNYEKRDKFLGVIRWAKDTIEHGIVQKLFKKEISQAGVIFYLINMNGDHWKQISKTEVDKRSLEKVEIVVKRA